MLFLQCMREAAEKRKELELERQEAQAQLREKQDEIKQLHKVCTTALNLLDSNFEKEVTRTTP